MEEAAGQEEKKGRKRRTVEELRAHYALKLQEVDGREKRELIRILSGVHDDLVKATTFKQVPQPETNQAIQATKGALAKLGIK